MTFIVNFIGKEKKITLSDYEMYQVIDDFNNWYDGRNPLLVAIANHMDVDPDDIWNIEAYSENEKGETKFFIFYEGDPGMI